MSRIVLGVGLVLLVVGGTVPVGASAPISPPHFAPSGLVASSRRLGSESPGASTSVRSAPDARGFATAGTIASSTLSTGANVNVVGSADVKQLGTINGVKVQTCNANKQTAQNETTIAVNPANGSYLVAGVNDYRLYEPTEKRYDGSGGVFRSTSGGTSWTAGFLPGLVRANSTAPGPYQSAGDPSVASGPTGVFWYANLAFNRADDASAGAVSRSTDNGGTWGTHFVLQTSATAGATLFNDKEWIAADNHYGSTSIYYGKVAYVTWTQFHTTTSGSYVSSPIVISKTVDGGAHWTAPKAIDANFPYSQGSVVQIDGSGRVHVAFETAVSPTRDAIVYYVSSDGGSTWTRKVAVYVTDIPSPLAGAQFRTDSFPSLAVAGSTVHLVWANAVKVNGTVYARLVYLRSTNSGSTWSSPALLASTSGDDWFPAVAARGAKVYVSWLHRGSANDTYTARAVGSSDEGATWSAPITISSAPSTVSNGNLFDYPNCSPDFIGDYSGLAVGPGGAAHPLWTDIRIGNDVSTSPSPHADQDPYTARLSLS
jgi:hypothetical protein